MLRREHFPCMRGVLKAAALWVETFTGLRMRQFERLLKVVRERGGDRPDGGRPWCLPLADRVLLVAVYYRTNLTMRVHHRTRRPAPRTPRPSPPFRRRGDNAERVRARVEHGFARMKHYKILRDCRRRGSRPTPTEDGESVLQVENRAPVLPELVPPRTEPLLRGTGRGRTGEHAGVGLTIVHSVARPTGTPPTGGLTATIRLPWAPEGNTSGRQYPVRRFLPTRLSTGQLLVARYRNDSRMRDPHERPVAPRGRSSASSSS
nr:hypothetical protein [Streptomyces sp. WAC01280]